MQSCRFVHTASLNFKILLTDVMMHYQLWTNILVRADNKRRWWLKISY